MHDFTEFYINKGVLLHVFCVSDDGNVVFAIAAGDAFAVDALDEHPLVSALHHFEISGFVLKRNLSHRFAALRLDGFGHLVGHSGGFGTGAHRVFERVDVAEANLMGEVAAFLEGCFGLAWEAYNNVGGEVEVGAEDFDTLAHIAELGGGVVAVHPFEGVVGATLQADVHVGREFFVLEQA